MTWSRSRNVAAVALIAVLAFGAASRAVLASQVEGVVSRTAVLVVNGRVLVGHGGDFIPVDEGDVLAGGDVVRTGADASAEITYFDGSSIWLDSDAEIVVQSLHVSDEGAAPMLERAWHVVTNLISGSARYEMRGPSSTASVRG